MINWPVFPVEMLKIGRPFDPKGTVFDDGPGGNNASVIDTRAARLKQTLGIALMNARTMLGKRSSQGRTMNGDCLVAPL